MGQDPLNVGRVFDHGDELHPPGAARASPRNGHQLVDVPDADGSRVHHTVATARAPAAWPFDAASRAAAPSSTTTASRSSMPR